MITMKRIVMVFTIFMMLTAMISTVVAAEENNDQIAIVQDDATNNSDSVVSNSDSKQSEDLSAKEIYSDEYVLGFKKGDGEFKDVVNTKESIRTMSAFDYVWAFVKLVFAILIGLILLGVPAVLLYIVIKIIIASRESNPHEAITKMLGERDRGTAVIISGGIILLYLIVFGFVVSLIS